MRHANATPRMAVLALSAALLAAPAAVAQPLTSGPVPHAAPRPQLSPTQRAITIPGGRQVVYETMVQKDPEGKVVRLDGPLDILALQRNPLVTPEVRERLRPAIREWMGEVERIAIDNLDFLEDIEPPQGGPGLLDRHDAANTNSAQRVNQVMTQLNAAGNLTTLLRGRNLLDQTQLSVNQSITADYLQECMREVVPPTEPASPEKTNRYTRFLYRVSASDAMGTYHRLLVQAAPNMERIVASIGLPPEAAAKVKDKAAAAAGATDDASRRAAARAVLNELTFPQRQAALTAARDMGPAYDPFPGSPSAALPSPRTGG